MLCFLQPTLKSLGPGAPQERAKDHSFTIENRRLTTSPYPPLEKAWSDLALAHYLECVASYVNPLLFLVVTTIAFSLKLCFILLT